jgi:rhodanese-related sulfurtransferase
VRRRGKIPGGTHSPERCVKNIDAAELQRLQQSGPAVLIDVRTDAEVARGLIPGARHIPLHALPQRVSELDPAVATIIYCQSGGRSAQACAWLEGHGFDSLMNLQGGIIGWVREGHPIEVPR